MWIKIRLIAIVVTPFLFGFFWGQAEAARDPQVEMLLHEEALEAAYAEGWREGSRYVLVNSRVQREK